MKSTYNHTSIHFYLLVLVILTYPFSLRISSILIGIWFGHWLWMIIRRQVSRPAWSWLILMLSFPAAYVLSLVYSTNQDYGVYSVVKRLSLIVFPVVFSTMSWDKVQRDRFLLWAYVSALIAALFCLVMAVYHYLTVGVSGFFWMDLVSPLHFHPGYFSFFISVVVFWFLKDILSTWNQRSLAYRIPSVASLLFLSVFQILLASRIQLVLFYTVLLIGGLVYGWRFNKKSLGLLILFFALSFWFISNSFIRQRFDKLSTITYKLDDPVEKFNELTIRLALAECSWDVIRENFIFGVGVGDSYDELDKVYRKYDYKFGYMDRQEPHNEYLNTMVSIGLVGLLLFLGNLIASMHLARKRNDIIHYLFVMLFAISCLFESMLGQQKGVVLFALFNSLFVFSGPLGKIPSFGGAVRTSDI